MQANTITDPLSRADELTEQDYRDIYNELREKRSLADFIALIQSTVSRSWWSQYEAGTKRLDTERKNELRRSVAQDELAPDVARVLASVSADATVWQLGNGTPSRVILLTPEAPETLTVRLNGDGCIGGGSPAQNARKARVTPVTRWADAPVSVLRAALENRQPYQP